MFVKDLDPYTHGVPTPLADVVSVGWLSAASGYSRGGTPLNFSKCLERLLSSHRVNQMRGYHVCDLCSISPLVHVLPSGKEIMLGSAEIWVPSVDKLQIYASPDLVIHYVTAHQYLPPDGFISAVMSASHTNEWDSNKECDSRIEAAFRT